jgi:hypothetical protein
MLMRSYEEEKETEYDLSVILNNYGTYFHRILYLAYISESEKGQEL